MGGLFGGLLWAIEAVGLIVLYCLIGDKARHPNATGVRLTFGGLTIGLVAGIAFGVTAAVWFPPEHATHPPDIPALAALCGFMGAIVGLVVTWVLEGVRRMLS
jgi:hypothetical protein